MEAATPEGLASTEDPGLRESKEAAEVLPLGKRPLQCKSASSFLIEKRECPKVTFYDFWTAPYRCTAWNK